MCKMMEDLDSGVIFDRNYITEAVYAEVFNRPTHHDILRYLEHTYADMGAITIYCYKSSYRKFDDQHISSEDLLDIGIEYNRYFDTHSIMPVLYLDTTSEDLAHQLEIIALFIKDET